jgi:hypothetical protein
MAEELLVKEALSKEMITAGRDLLGALEKAGWVAQSAFWLFDPDANRWKLKLSSPEVETKGRRPAFELVSKILSNSEIPLTLFDISIVPPRDRTVKVMSAALKTIPTSGIRVSRAAFDGHYIEDAYVYRS